MALPSTGDTIEVKPPPATDWEEAIVTREVEGGFCVGKPKKEVWFGASSEDTSWRIPA